MSLRSMIILLLLTNFISADNIDDLKQEAIQLFYQKKYKEAMLMFDKVTTSRPTDTEANLYYARAFSFDLKALVYIKRARQLSAQGRYNQSLSSLIKAEKLSPYHSEIEDLRQDINKKKEDANVEINVKGPEAELLKSSLEQGKLNLNKGRYEIALNYYAKSLAIAPKHPDAVEGYYEAKKRYEAETKQKSLKRLFLQAEGYRKKRDFVMAIAKYDEILRYDPNNQLAHRQRTRAKAVLDDRRSQSEKKRFATELLTSGNSFLKERKYEEAIGQFEQGQNIEPSIANWSRLIKRAERSLNKEKKKQYKSKQKELVDFFKKGLVAIRTGNFKDAVRYFERVVIIARLYEQIETMTQAEELLSKAKESLARKEEEKVSRESPYYELVQSLQTLGVRQFQLKKYRKAKQYFKSIIDLFPKNQIASEYYYQCEIELKPEYKKQIIEDLLEQIRQAKDNDKAEANRLAKVAYKIDPSNRKLAALYRQAKKKENIIQRSNVSDSTLNKWYNRAVSLSQTNLQAAKKQCKKILKENVAHIKTQTLLAKIEGRLSSGTRVRKKIGKPKAQKAYSQGILHYNNGRIKKAAAAFKAAVRIDPNYSKAKIALQKCNAYLKT